MCSRHQQLAHVIGVGPQWARTNVRQIQRYAKMDEQIKMLLAWNQKPWIKRDAHWRQRANTTERSVRGGDAVFHYHHCSSLSMLLLPCVSSISLNIHRCAPVWAEEVQADGSRAARSRVHPRCSCDRCTTAPGTGRPASGLAGTAAHTSLLHLLAVGPKLTRPACHILGQLLVFISDLAVPLF